MENVYDNYEPPRTQKYIGSVRFYKNMIFFSILAVIVLLAVLCISSWIANRSLRKSVSVLKDSVFALEDELSEAKSAAEEAEAAAAEESSSDASDTEQDGSGSSVDYVSDTTWALLLVNESHPVPDLDIELNDLSNGLYVDSRISTPLKQMLAAGEAEGLEFVVCSAYRTVNKQMELFLEDIEKSQEEGMTYEDAFQQAELETAMPGYSEHQTGLAVDIVSKSYQVLDERQADTAEAQWLLAHCSEYGFILRYPADKTVVTSYHYEPWHFRYVGTEAASVIMEHNLTLEEYLAFWQ